MTAEGVASAVREQAVSAGFVVETEVNEVLVPLEAAASLEAFRRWSLSDDCPDAGRIDYIAGRIEVSDMSGEELFAHGTLKGKLYAAILSRVEKDDLGYVFVDSTRVASLAAALSAEPDVAVVTYDAIETGRVRLVPKAGGEAGRYVEVEGPPDLVVEVVSDSTVRKDTVRLPRAYFEAGVTEFWLVDGRRELAFAVHARGRSAFEPVAVDADGFQPSIVLGCSVRLDRVRDRLGAWRYDLVAK